MEMERSGCPQSIRFQIPLVEDVMGELAHLANRMERSQAWMAAKLLEEVIASQERLGGWLEAGTTRVVGKSVRFFTKRKLRGRREQKLMRLQVLLPEELARKIGVLAERFDHTPVRMAGLLLEWAIADHGWVIGLVTTKWGMAIAESLYGAKEQSNPLREARPGVE